MRAQSDISHYDQTQTGSIYGSRCGLGNWCRCQYVVDGVFSTCFGCRANGGAASVVESPQCALTQHQPLSKSLKLKPGLVAEDAVQTDIPRLGRDRRVFLPVIADADAQGAA